MRHLGQDRNVTEEQARLDKRVLRALHGKPQGQMAEGKLAGWCGSKMSSAEWRGAISRLVEWGLVVLAPVGFGNAQDVCLTPHGAGWGEELACSARSKAMTELLTSLCRCRRTARLG
jgi:hypothetical protein